MEINTLEELAPWIAITITLALSILVPVFTQMANNKFQLELQKRKEENERKNMLYEEKRKIYADFLQNVGACVSYRTKDNIDVAGASIQRLYLVCPEEWWPDIDMLFFHVRGLEWAKAEDVLKKLNKLIAKEYGAIN